MNLSYPVAVGHGMLDRLPDVLEQVSPGNRVAIVSKGKVQAAGTLTELRDRYDQPDLEELFFQLVS